MKQALVVMVVTAAVNLSSVLAAPVTVSNFTDMLFWAGSGTNQAALILEFPTTIDSGTAVQAVEPTAIAWGYRWNGQATMADMLFSLAGTITGDPSAPHPADGADSRLAMDVTNWGGTLGWGINQISYDQRSLGEGWSQVVRSIDTDYLTWAYYPAQYNLVSVQGVWTGESFNANDVGISSLGLVDGGWYGVLQAFTDENGNPPGVISFSQPVAAVPEPSTIVLVACGAAAGLVIRRRRHRAA